MRAGALYQRLMAKMTKMMLDTGELMLDIGD
jgi:hypothetical protein